VFASSGVVIAVGGSNTSSTSIPTCVSLLVMPVSTTQWAGLLGA
jgi:UDP:flavonoid glycosyltransferase YjiC (YdhE family)